ncbi:MAG: CDP-alcohol phosphatidyltransferase family protein [Acutalibacteraceae bacterium]|jgi:cardiolipin synthase|nr:CDP-alcohol phosphatidyltransferase family protein [Clostridiales bacterium]
MSNLKTQMEDIFKGGLTIPNALSAVRILLIPLFVYLFYTGDVKGALIVIIVSGITDSLDGRIARKYNQITALGKLLDPVADKLTQITIAIMLFIEFDKSDSGSVRSFRFVFLLFLAKELLMMLGGVVLLAKNIRPGAAEVYGKVSTFTFYTVMLLIIAFGPDFGAFREFFQFHEVTVMVLVLISAVMTIIAFISYIPGTITELKDKKTEKVNNKNI